MTWGFRLGNSYLSGGSNDTNLTTPACSGVAKPMVVGCLSKPPDGLAVPGIRDEDVAYAQRDGVKHFNDWYEPRIITLEDVTVCNDNCGCASENSARVKRSQLLKDWRRSCCDIEAVVFTDCNGQFEEGDPILGQQTIRRNLVWNPSFEEDLNGWTRPVDSFCRSYDRCYDGAGNTWCYSNAVDGAFDSSQGTDGGYVGDGYMRLTVTVVPTNPGTGFTFGPSQQLSPDVEAEATYTASAYLRTSGDQELIAQVLWYDQIGTLIGIANGPAVPVVGGGTWTRVAVTATAPEGAVYAHPQWVTNDVAGWVVGGTLDIDAALFEIAHQVQDYFDGDTPDTDDPVPGGKRIQNVWAGNEHDSDSLQSSQTYEENIDRSLYGPFGIIGRPRVADVEWIGQGSSCAQGILRFDATDQRMYVLDACGTPGYQECRTVRPGVQTRCRSYDMCYSDGGRCYSADSFVGSVLPVILPVGGTERINPMIVLYPKLTYPTIENMNNDNFITFNGIVEAEAIVIDTENGTAEGMDSGTSYTHLLGGSLFLSMTPGEVEFRMFTRGDADTGAATICWRDTVVMG